MKTMRGRGVDPECPEFMSDCSQQSIFETGRQAAGACYAPVGDGNPEDYIGYRVEKCRKYRRNAAIRGNQNVPEESADCA